MGIRNRAAAGVFLLLVSVISSPLFAIDPAKPGELRIHLAVAPSPDFLKEWVSTPSTHPITIKRLHKMKVGQVAYIGFILTGWVAKPGSAADVEVDCQILNPDGTMLFNLPRYARYRGDLAGPSFVMADPAVDFQVDPGDQVGVYRVLVTARDKRSGKSAKDEHALQVEE